jgi:DNA repair exonuclease SbcCD ATPase subunit
MKEMSYDEDEKDEDMKESDLDEEIDLEEILNELELEENEEVSEETVDEGKDEADEDMKEGKMKDADEDMKEGKMKDADEDMKEGKDDIDEDIEEAVGYPNHRADQVQKVKADATDVNQGLNEGEDFDLDALLEEINNLDENSNEVNEEVETLDETEEIEEAKDEVEEAVNPLAAELEETKAALDTVRAELNEVNLLNSKLLYVNRIFKANQLDESQKLRVVETLDKAESTKEAKLIYETIKDTFNVAKSKKESFKNKTKSLKEGIGMASKAAGTSTAPKKEVISESSDMMKRFQKLANIKINQ